MLTGGRARRVSRKVRIPKLPKGRKRRAPAPIIPSTATATASERAALQNLAQRLQRGDITAWRNATPSSSTLANEAAKAAAFTGRPSTATDLLTGNTASAVPLTGSGVRRRARKPTKRRQLKGGILPALLPIIAAAIGAIPGIAGTAVGIASLQEQKRQFNKMYGNR